jgi:hypothetical protein
MDGRSDSGSRSGGLSPSTPENQPNEGTGSVAIDVSGCFLGLDCAAGKAQHSPQRVVIHKGRLRLRFRL